MLGLGVLLFLPAILCPLFLDDYLHAAMIRGAYPAKRGPLDLYNFIDETVRDVFFARGALPWWASPDIKLKFFRPLSSLVVWFDHVCLRVPLLMHLHSLAWWAATALAARALFRRYLPERAATLAFIIYALAPCHVLPLAWLANRETFIALTFGTLGLLSYVRFREEGGARRAAAAIGLFSLAMLSGEYGFCVGGYVLAYEVFRKDALLYRVSSLFLFAGPAAGYLVLRRLGDYGARGSGFYTDPFVNLGSYLSSAPLRFGAILADSLLSPDIDAINPRWIAFVIIALLVAVAFRPIARARAAYDAKVNSATSFMVVGAALSLVPVSSVIPSARVIGAAMVGVAGGIGTFLEYAWFKTAESALPVKGDLGPARAAVKARGPDRRTSFVAILFGFAHLVRGPALALVASIAVRERALTFLNYARSVREHMTDISGKYVVVVRSTEEIFFLPYMLMAEGVTDTPTVIALTDATHVLLRSRDEKTIDAIVPVDQTVVREGEGTLFRDDSHPLHRGSTVTTHGIVASVEEMGEHGPSTVRFRFSEDFDSPSYLWLTTGKKAVREIEPPRPGFGMPIDP